MQLQLETRLPCSYAEAVAQMKTPRLMMHIAKPLIRFDPVEGTTIPSVWEEKTYWFRLQLFGVLPFGQQAISISLREEPGVFRVHDAGFSRLIKTWDHRITIEDHPDGVRYRDSVDLDAGLLTPVVWLFSQVFFRHRQRRWRQLAQAGFVYGDDRG